MKESIDFLVERQNLRHCKFVRTPAPDATSLAPGQTLLAIAEFAFTANNVTYAVVGDMMSYWTFFPAEAGFGRIPVWGFADVVASKHPEIQEGERIFGYLPMSTYLIVAPERATRGGFIDASPHRKDLPIVYNQYSRCAGDPGYDPAHEAEQMLYRPLFMTAFLIDDFLADNDFFGARAVVLSSASSKTAFGLAYLLRRGGRAQVIGLTSPSNAAFVEGLGCYDRVVSYDAISKLPADVPAAFVDMAGNGKVASAVHRHWRDNLKHSAIVGATHWENGARDGDLPGATPTLFFAPTQVEKRTKDWGADGLQKRLGAAWRDLLGFVAGKVNVTRGSGTAAVERVYVETLEGRARPDAGYVLSL